MIDNTNETNEVASFFDSEEAKPEARQKRPYNKKEKAPVSEAAAFFAEQEAKAQSFKPENNTNEEPDTGLEMVFGTKPSTKADLAKARKQRIEAQAVEDRGHYRTTELPRENIPEDAINTPVHRNDNPTSPNIPEKLLLQMIRAEEAEAEMVKTQGRYIPGSDDARPGVPFKQTPAIVTDPSHMSNVTAEPYLEGVKLRKPLIAELNLSGDGINRSGSTRILDTGEGAQALNSNGEIINPELVDHQVYGENKTVASSNPNDPRSEAFLACNNRQCAYREGCLRYRLKNRRNNAFPFFPESCRKDGIYISINDSKFTGYDPFDQLERGASGLTSLPLP